MKTKLGSLVACLACGFIGAAANGQVVADGNMDNLAVGTAPDNMTPAGAWAFPPNYVSAGVAEPVTRPDIYSIVPTNSFKPGASGNSLHLLNSNATVNDNYHLPNVWTRSFTAGPGVVISVDFNFWVASGSGGGSIYVGGDNGGGGFSNGTGDRTAQLSWLADGSLNAANNLGVNVPLASYGFNEWQNVRIIIDTGARSYDLFWSMGANPLAQIGNDLVFRAPNPLLSVNYDRISYVQFGGTVPNVNSYLDNVVVVPAPGAVALLGLLGAAGVAQRRRR